jgi:hypothetical protein
MKLLTLVVLMFISSWLFAIAQKAGNAEVTALFAFLTVGLMIAIFVVALSRGGSRRR